MTFEPVPVGARGKFPKGTKVVVSAEFKKTFRTIRSSTPQIGVVVGHSRDDECIYVVLDGRTTRYCYHYKFWKKVK